MCASASALTILEGLHDFRVARLALDAAIERRHEELVFGVLFQIGDDVRLGRRRHHRHDVVLLRAAAQVAEPDVQALRRRASMCPCK